MASHKSHLTPMGLILWTGAVIVCAFALIFSAVAGGQIFYVGYRIIQNADQTVCDVTQPTGPSSQDADGKKK